MSITKIFTKKPGGKKEKKMSKAIIWRTITMSVMAILFISIFGSAYFAYNNIYLTLVNAHSIFLLESKLGAENVDIKAYEEAVEAIKSKKQKTEIPANLRNIFDYGIEPIMPTSTTSTTLELTPAEKTN